MRTAGDTAHIGTTFKFLPQTRQRGCIDVLHCCNDPCLVPARSRGNGGTNNRSLTYPQTKKSQGAFSGDLGGHSISCWSFPDARPIQHPGNTAFRYWRTSQWNLVSGFHGSVHHVDCSKWNQRDAVQQVFYCTLIDSTCFGCRRHPSSGAQYVQSRSVGTMCCNSINII